MLKNTTIQAFIALFTLSLIWGYNWVVMKISLQYAGVFQFIALRTFLGAACLFLIIFLMRKPLKIKHMPSIFLLGLLQTSGFTGLLMWALVDGGAGKTAVLTFTMPFWVMMMAWPLLGEKLTGMQWIAAIFSALGILFILNPLHLGTGKFSMFLAVCSGICWALAVILAKKLNQKAPDLDLLVLTAWQMLFGSIPILIVAFMVSAPPIQWTSYFIGSVIYNAVLCNALAWLLWLFALHRLQAGVASMTSMLIPVIGVLAAWIQLSEIPSAYELVGMVCIALSLGIISVVSIRKQKISSATATLE